MLSTAARAFLVLNASLPLIVNLYEDKYRQDDKQKSFPLNPPDFGLPIQESFDFIIVGAGSAGCVLARRLSANYKVLLLEAGGEPPPPEDIPTLAQLTKRVPSIHWMYSSTKQKNSGLDENGVILSSGGKMMGGSGSHNHCQYERGHPHDYDHWANVTGDESYRFKAILKFFLKTENYKGKFPTRSPEGLVVHHKGGLINVITTNFTFDHIPWFEAGKELGYMVDVDPNGPQQEGFGRAEYNRKNGRRMSAYSAMVKTVEHQWSNLTVRRYSVVSEIIFEGKRAIGVQYEHHGIPKAAFVTKEVILSAGAYISPIILIKSGIGPPDQVASIKKDLVMDLPVGENLNDHVIVRLPPITVEDKSVFIYSQKNISFQEFNNFVVRGEGFLSTYVALQEAFIASQRATFIDRVPDWPDIQLYFGQTYHEDQDVLACMVNINRQYSRGKIAVNSTVTKNLEESLIPIIDYNFFSDETDYDVAIEGIELCRKIVEQTETFRKIGAKFMWNVVPPACGNPTNIGYRDYWKCYIRHRSWTNNHVTSTNKMGKVEDPTTVVDSKFRVKGITGLRVVDASVFPSITNANINAVVIMLAEKAAVDVAKHWS